nr:unnamed protein product [Digitaria exilis]
MFSAMRCSLELEDDEPEPRALEPRRAAAAAAATAEQLQRQQHAAAARWPGSSSKQQYAVEKHGGGGEEKDRAESGQKQLEEAWRLALGFRRGRDWGNMRLNDGNIQNVWMRGTKLPGQGFICGYCGFVNHGGGATRLRDHLGAIVGEVKQCNSVPRAVRDAIKALQKSTMEKKREKEQPSVLNPETHYRHNFSSNPEYAQTLTDVIEKMADTPEDAVQAIQEIGFFRECQGRFSHPTARAGASSMPPSQLDRSAHERNHKSKNGKRVRSDEDEFEFLDSEDGDGDEGEFEDALSDGDDESGEVNSDDDHDDNRVEISPRVEASSEGDRNANGRRSARIHPKKMRIQSLYARE